MRGRFSAVLLVVGVGAGLSAACTQEKAAPPLSSLKPEPLPNIQRAALPDASVDPREALHQIRPFEVFGRTPEQTALTLRATAAGVTLNGELLELSLPEPRAKLENALAALKGDDAVTLSFDDEVYLAQLVTLLQALDDGGARLLMKHPSGPVFDVTLRDEPAFNAWLAEPVPGRLRIVQRADGMELTTNIGKLPGPDANGPSIPIRGGQLDIATMREALGKLKKRFGDKDAEVCLLPSFGTELRKIADVMSGTYRAENDAIYPSLCLVYPRPAPKK